MFDIHEYYTEDRIILSEVQTKEDTTSFEHQINEEIEHILFSPRKSGFSTVRFRRKKKSIDIHAPLLYCPFAGNTLPSIDSLRFLLSLYPDKEDINRIRHIIIRPRFIESGGVQVVALYFPQTQTLVNYISLSHYYTIDDPAFFKNENFDIDLSTITNPHYLGQSPQDETPLRVPSLFYIIKMLSHKKDQQVEKFLLKLENRVNQKEIGRFRDISHFFSQHGY